MMFLDFRTVFITSVFVFAVCTVLVAQLWWQSRQRFAGLDLLAVDFSLQTVAMLLLSLRGLIPDLLSVSLTNILALSGAILGYMGLQRFVGRTPASPWPNYLFLILYSLVFIYYGVVPVDIRIRSLTATLGLMIIWLQCFWLLMFQVDPAWRPLTRWVAAAYGGYVLVNVLRIGYYFGAPPRGYDYLRAGDFEVSVFIAYLVLLVFLTYSLALMVNKRLFGHLKTQEEKFSKAFRSSPNAIVLSRLMDAKILEFNEGFLHISGYREDEVRGKTTLELNLWSALEDRETLVAEVSRTGGMKNREFKFRNKGGNEIIGLLAAEIITVEDERCLLVTISDISERKRMEEEIKELSLRDAMTGLYNRRGFFTIADQELKIARRSGKKLSLVYIDCDGLKMINDTFGHEEGDRALKAAAEVLNRTFRSSDVIARMGGDEFAVLSLDAPEQERDRFAGRLRTIIDNYNAQNPGPWRLAMSWGTAVYDPERHQSLDEVIAAADQIMYQMKSRRKAGN